MSDHIWLFTDVKGKKWNFAGLVIQGDYFPSHDICRAGITIHSITTVWGNRAMSLSKYLFCNSEPGKGQELDSN